MTAGDINERFQIIDEKLAVKASNLFEQHPEALLEMFVILGESPTLKGIRSNTIRLAKTHVHLINDSFRQSETATGLFIRLGVEHHLFSVKANEPLHSAPTCPNLKRRRPNAV